QKKREHTASHSSKKLAPMHLDKCCQIRFTLAKVIKVFHLSRCSKCCVSLDTCF
ncbi:hypothetical protein NDU88_004912, partial [Pleurodeles waltl]